MKTRFQINPSVYFEQRGDQFFEVNTFDAFEISKEKYTNYHRIFVDKNVTLAEKHLLLKHNLTQISLTEIQKMKTFSTAFKERIDFAMFRDGSCAQFHQWEIEKCLTLVQFESLVEKYSVLKK